MGKKLTVTESQNTVPAGGAIGNMGLEPYEGNYFSGTQSSQPPKKKKTRAEATVIKALFDFNSIFIKIPENSLSKEETEEVLTALNNLVKAFRQKAAQQPIELLQKVKSVIDALIEKPYVLGNEKLLRVSKSLSEKIQALVLSVKPQAQAPTKTSTTQAPKQEQGNDDLPNVFERFAAIAEKLDPNETPQDIIDAARNVSEAVRGLLDDLLVNEPEETEGGVTHELLLPAEAEGKVTNLIAQLSDLAVAKGNNDLLNAAKSLLDSFNSMFKDLHQRNTPLVEQNDTKAQQVNFEDINKSSGQKDAEVDPQTIQQNKKPLPIDIVVEQNDSEEQEARLKNLSSERSQNGGSTDNGKYADTRYKTDDQKGEDIELSTTTQEPQVAQESPVEQPAVSIRKKAKVINSNDPQSVQETAQAQIGTRKRKRDETIIPEQAVLRVFCNNIAMFDWKPNKSKTDIINSKTIFDNKDDIIAGINLTEKEIKDPKSLREGTLQVLKINDQEELKYRVSRGEDGVVKAFVLAQDNEKLHLETTPAQKLKLLKVAFIVATLTTIANSDGNLTFYGKNEEVVSTGIAFAEWLKNTYNIPVTIKSDNISDEKIEAAREEVKKILGENGDNLKFSEPGSSQKVALQDIEALAKLRGRCGAPYEEKMVEQPQTTCTC